MSLSFCQEARTTYRRILQESARKLNTQGSHLGSCIEKARPYYEARRLAKEVRPADPTFWGGGCMQSLALKSPVSVWGVRQSTF